MKHNFIAFYYTRKSVKWNNLKGIFPFYTFLRRFSYFLHSFSESACKHELVQFCRRLSAFFFIEISPAALIFPQRQCAIRSFNNMTDSVQSPSNPVLPSTIFGLVAP